MYLEIETRSDVMEKEIDVRGKSFIQIRGFLQELDG